MAEINDVGEKKLAAPIMADGDALPVLQIGEQFLDPVRPQESIAINRK